MNDCPREEIVCTLFQFSSLCESQRNFLCIFASISYLWLSDGFCEKEHTYFNFLDAWISGALVFQAASFNLCSFPCSISVKVVHRLLHCTTFEIYQYYSNFLWLIVFSRNPKRFIPSETSEIFCSSLFGCVMVSTCRCTLWFHGNSYLLLKRIFSAAVLVGVWMLPRSIQNVILHFSCLIIPFSPVVGTLTSFMSILN